MSASSEKIHSPSKESSADDQSIRGDENAPIRPIDPKVLRRATLKIDFYLIPIIGMFCELSLLLHPIPVSYRSISRSFVFSCEYSCGCMPVNLQTLVQLQDRSYVAPFRFVLVSDKRT